MKRADVFGLIESERACQLVKWGGVHAWGAGDCSGEGISPELKMVVLAEEVGEVARAVFERDGQNLRDELVQVAAVAVAWLESLT